LREIPSLLSVPLRVPFTAGNFKASCGPKGDRDECSRWSERRVAVGGGWGVARDGRPVGGGERASPYQALPRGRSATVSLVENILVGFPGGARAVGVSSYFSGNVRNHVIPMRPLPRMDIPDDPRRPAEVSARTRCELAAVARDRG